MSGTTIELRGVTKTFPRSSAPAVAPLDLTMPSGTTTVLIGPSGCGKTTTLRMINRLIEPTGGTITIGGTDVRDRPTTELRRELGYVIQQVGLFPHRTIGQNIATVPRLLGWDRARTSARVAELAELVGIDPDLLDRYPAELSGGQQQRVGVARALAADPPVLLMDEPFGAVDPIVRGRLQQELLDLQARLHKTIVLVTHDIDEALALGDQVAVLNVGGVLEQVAEPDDLLARPANEFVERFLGADRTIRRLGLATVADLLGAGADGAASTPPVVPGDGSGRPTLQATATRREALDLLLATGSDALTVVDGDGAPVGAIGLDDLRRGLGA